MKGETIGKIAKAAGVSIDTVRFYQKQGLIEKPPKQIRGFRYYPQEAVGRIHFVKRAKALGFTLREIKALFRLQITRGANCKNVLKIAESKIKEIDDKMKLLKAMKTTIMRLLNACDGRGKGIQDCSLIKSLKVPISIP